MTRLTTASTRGRGFTLVELLVAIAIIAVLAAILFPAFVHARGKARQARCLSNVRQIGAAVLAYAADWHDCCPLAFCGPPPSRFSTPWEPVLRLTWWDVILPYLGRSEAILFCPAVKSYTPTYQMAGALAEPKGSWLGGVANPTNMVLVVEGRPPDERMEPKFRYVAPSTSFIFRSLEFPYHHFGKMNACFVDGHAKPLGEQELDMGSPLFDPTK